MKTQEEILFRFRDLFGSGRGIECGNGWNDLIWISLEKLEKIPDIRIFVIKEKFGSLRIQWEYIGYEDGKDMDDDTMDNLCQIISEADVLSRTICEYCGSTENIIRTTGYIQHLCQKCLEENK